ncbi:YraN family protein [Undibacterium sp. RuRC25W]|uniref:YraN family protein n=1 Tax=Undibacterium sp. RuRC25W TaxID=3413047 RepID=UPI003BF1EA19
MRRQTVQECTLEDKRTDRRRQGDEGELQAMRYLEQAGLRLVQRNFLCKGGEIDLIMRDKKTLVFVEVRVRNSMRFGGAIASITPAKLRKMRHAAQLYLMQLKSLPACRFDVIAIEAGTIHWLQNIIVA